MKLLSRSRIPALLIALGIWILLGRTIAMMVGGHLVTNVWWVAGLLVLEFLVNVTVFLSAARWWMSARPEHRRLPLRATVMAVVLHAIRVAIYAIGRVGPWIDFDVRPAFRAVPPEPAQLVYVVFASVMAALSLVVVVVVWRLATRRARPDSADG